MNIQDSPKQIALTNDQINGIRNKYAAMIPAVPVVENTSTIANDPSIGLPQAEIQFTNSNNGVATPQIEQNIFDAAPVIPETQVIETSSAPAAPSAQVIQGPAESAVPNENIFDIPTAPIQDNTNAFPQTPNIPTNADIISNDQNMFNAFDNNPIVPEVAPVLNTGNTFEQNQAVPNGIPYQVPTNNSITFEELLAQYADIQKTVVNLYAMLEAFGTQMESFIKNNPQNQINQTQTRL